MGRCEKNADCRLRKRTYDKSVTTSSATARVRSERPGHDTGDQAMEEESGVDGVVKSLADCIGDYRDGN